MTELSFNPIWQEAPQQEKEKLMENKLQAAYSHGHNRLSTQGLFCETKIKVE